jgi:hypothetical protein
MSRKNWKIYCDSCQPSAFPVPVCPCQTAGWDRQAPRFMAEVFSFQLSAEAKKICDACLPIGVRLEKKARKL